MKLEKQVVSLELAKKLKELGVKQDSHFSWFEMNTGKFELYHSGLPTSKSKFSAFTVAELGEMLLIQFTILKGVQISDPRGRYSRLVKRLYIFEDEANARAKMLIYLLENDLIKNK